MSSSGQSAGQKADPVMETECDSAARQRSHEPQKADLSSPAKSKLVMVLGGVSATAMASLLSSAQATPALADMLTKGSTPATLRLLAQIALARSAAAILLLPAIGRLADRYGRKVVLMYTALATAVGHGMTAAFPSAFTLILGQALVGALSVGGANDAVRDASLADVMRNDELASSTAKARACMALGMIAGPLLGGVAAKRNVRLPFVVASVASLGGAVLCATQLVETLAPERQRECAESQDSNGGTFAPEHCLNPVSSIELLRRSPKLRWLTVACALSMGSEFNADVTPLFCRDRLGWDAVAIGKFTATGGIAAVLSSMSCSTVLKTLGQRWLTLIGTAFHVLRNLIMSSAHTDGGMYASLVGILCGGVTMRLSSLLSKHSEIAIADGLGGAEATAMRGNAMALMRLVVPVIATRLYGPGTEGHPYLFSASLAVAAGAIVVAADV